jgi:hypothetical protein
LPPQQLFLPISSLPTAKNNQLLPKRILVDELEGWQQSISLLVSSSTSITLEGEFNNSGRIAASV